jgi:hypothetical protein
MSRITELPHKGSASEARVAMQKRFKCRKEPSLSEVLASLIILTPEFIELMALAGIPHWADANALANYLAPLIVGSTPYLTRPFLGEIISGAVDADKLDYMARDCYLAGLPMPVDVERLLQKLQAVGVSGSSESGKYWVDFTGLSPNETIYVLAVDERGGIAAEELVVSRVLLYSKLYHHQKVRALEGLVENALDVLIYGEQSFSSIDTYFRLTDADFLAERWNAGGSDYFTRAARIVRRIGARYEIVRALAFSPAMVKTPVEDPIAWAKLKPYVSRERTPESLEFRERIVELAKSYLNLCGSAAVADTLTLDSIIVDLPEPQGISEKTRFYVGNEEMGVRHYSEVARVDRWAEAYEADKSIGYVFAPPEHAMAIHLAARLVIREISGITFEDRQLTLTKIVADELIAFARVLHDRGARVVEIDLPLGAKPVAPMPSRAEVESRFGGQIAELASRFHGYTPVDGPAVDAQRIVDWLTQFARDDVHLAMTVLQSVKYWTRRALADALRIGLQRLAERHSLVQLVPLGGPTTSAEHLKYIFGDIDQTELRLEVRLLSSMEDLRPNVPVVFYDDYIGSGGQSITVFMQWFGRPRTDWKVNEHHVEPLSRGALAKLETCEVNCFFVAGRRDGLALLMETLATMHPQAKDGWILSPSDVSCFRPAASVFANDDADRAQKVFQAAGLCALTEESWPNDKKLDRALGYGNNADLTVFWYNVPASTLTALWKESRDKEAPWSPLFLRRKRVSATGNVGFGSGAL